MSNKDFTSADAAIDKFFSKTKEEQTQNTQQAHNTQQTQNTNISEQIEKRNERFSLLLNKKLKNNLFNLSKATGSKSINDFIVKVLSQYVEKTENQAKLEQYKKLLEE